MQTTADRPGTAPAVRPAPSGRGRRVALVVVVVVLAAAPALLGSLLYVTSRLGGIRRVAVDGIVPVGSGQPQTILLAGSDSRAGESAADAQRFGSASQVAGQRSDVIILVHIDPGHGAASMLSIPRDLFVPIAGTGKSNRINVAFDQGPGALVRTISTALGITVNHFAEENFSGLQSIATAVGGVCMNFAYPARDGSPSGQGNESGLDIPTAGRHTLDGSQALALVRSRYYQYYAGGAWRAEGTGDIGRIERQHVFMRALAAKALHASVRNPFTASRVLSRATGGVTVDNRFTDMGLLRLALHLRSLRPTGIPSWTLPYRAVNGYGGYGDVLLPEPSQDAAVIAAWQASGKASAAPAGPPPSAITVRVLNGSGVAGQAALTAAGLRADGFTVTGFATGRRGTATTVAYAPGHEAAARVVAGVLGGGATLVRDHGLSGDVVVVTTGPGFGGVRPAPAGGGSAGGAAPPASGPPPWDPTPC